jgi:hypothetical protein
MHIPLNCHFNYNICISILLAIGMVEKNIIFICYSLIKTIRDIDHVQQEEKQCRAVFLVNLLDNLCTCTSFIFEIVIVVDFLVMLNHLSSLFFLKLLYNLFYH